MTLASSAVSGSMLARSTFSGQKIAYRVHRQAGREASPGPVIPLVLLCGIACVKEQLDGLVAQLLACHGRALASDRTAAELAIITLDNRGMGASPLPVMPAGVDAKRFSFYRFEELAQDVVDVVEHLGYKHAIVLGHSMGGMIAQEVLLHATATQEGTVAGVIVAGSLTFAQDPKGVLPADWQKKMVEFAKTTTPPRGGFKTASEAEAFRRKAVQKQLTPEWVEANPEAFEAICADLAGLPKSEVAGVAQQNKALKFWRENIDRDAAAFTARYGAVPGHVPVMLVHGRGDQVNGFYHSEHLQTLLPGAKFVSLGQVGHEFWKMDGGAGAEQILDFCLSCTAGGRGEAVSGGPPASKL